MACVQFERASISPESIGVAYGKHIALNHGNAGMVL
jgi:hypothetical protein